MVTWWLGSDAGSFVAHVVLVQVLRADIWFGAGVGPADERCHVVHNVGLHGISVLSVDGDPRHVLVRGVQCCCSNSHLVHEAQAFSSISARRDLVVVHLMLSSAIRSVVLSVLFDASDEVDILVLRLVQLHRTGLDLVASALGWSVLALVVVRASVRDLLRVAVRHEFHVEDAGAGELGEGRCHLVLDELLATGAEELEVERDGDWAGGCRSDCW